MIPVAPRRRFGLFAIGGVVILLGIVAIPLTRSPEVSAGPLPVITQVPIFSFTERNGQTVTNADLLGRIWVVDFFFTSCTGPCPEMTLRMRSLQESVRSEHLPVTLVSVSIDPEYDRPGVLRRYADKYGADPDHWLFLTGEDQDHVHELVKSGFLIAVEKATETTPLIHGTYLLLIDPAGRIRGVYESLVPSSKRRLMADVRRLVQDAAQP